MNIQSQVYLKLVSPEPRHIFFLFNLLYPGSHDFQNITVSSSSPGEIGVTGDFIPGSLAIGILVVVYLADYNTIINYYFIHRFSVCMSSPTNLPNGQYKVSVFVVEENGLPFNTSAITPRNVSLTESKLHYTYNIHHND